MAICEAVCSGEPVIFVQEDDMANTVSKLYFCVGMSKIPVLQHQVNSKINKKHTVLDFSLHSNNST